MNFLKRLFGGGTTTGTDRGIYLYVKIRRTGEIIRVRLTPGYDISQNDEGNYFARKIIIGTRSFDQIEANFYFDSRYQFTNADISGGELSTEAAYLAQEQNAS